jgi:beta-N-acetylhexosaminidase
VDSHRELPHLDRELERLRSLELMPFAAAVAAGVASVMTAHLLIPRLDPALPCTLSPAAIGLLRGEIGFDGLVFGDDLEMKAVADHFTPDEMARRALEAGVDVLLVCRRADLRNAVLAALEALPVRLVEPGLRRLAAFKRRYSGGRHASGGGPPYPEHLALAGRLCEGGSV